MCLRTTYVCVQLLSRPTLGDLMDCSMPGFCPLLLPWVYSNSCPLSWWCYLTISSSVTCFPFAFSLSQYQGLFQWVSSSHQVAKVLELQLQHQSFQWYSGLISFRIDWFDLFAVQGLSRVFSSTTVQKHQFFGTQPSLWSSSHICAWLQEKP